MTPCVPLTSLGAWIFSMIVHASGLCVAILLAAEFSVVPQIAPFRWDVTLVAASKPEPLMSDTPSPALVSPAPEEPVRDDPPLPPAIQAVHRPPSSSRSVPKQAVSETVGRLSPGSHLHAPAEATPFVENSRDVAEPSPQKPSAESPTPTKMVWPVTSSTPAEMPPPAVEASDQSNMAMKPTVQEASRLVHIPAPQFRPTPVSRRTQPDYGWLASAVATEVQQIKRYPAQAKWHRWQGKVVVQAVIHEDGRISDVEVIDSSGHDTLDLDAVALLERISPVQLQYPLDQSSIVIRIPIGYRLE